MVLRNDGTAWVKLTPKEIDDQANCEESQWFQRQGLCFASEILIGTQRGMAAVRYDDVEKVILKTNGHIDWGSRRSFRLSQRKMW